MNKVKNTSKYFKVDVPEWQTENIFEYEMSDEVFLQKSDEALARLEVTKYHTMEAYLQDSGLALFGQMLNRTVKKISHENLKTDKNKTKNIIK